MQIKNILLVFLLLSVTGYSQPDHYQFKRRLDSIGGEGYYFIPLKPEVTAFCKSDLSDIRLFNINGKDTIEIPFVFQDRGDKIKSNAFDIDMINNVEKEKCCSFITLKLKGKKILNTIHLDIEDVNFDKQLVLEGSNDNKEWFTIMTHLRIVGFENGSIKFSSTSIEFPDTEYEYFRIKFNDDSSEKVKVRSAYAYENQTDKGRYDELEIRSIKQSENKKDKISEIIADLGLKHRVDHLSLQVDSKSDFYRSINIYKSNGRYTSEKGGGEIWQLVGSGVISSERENVFLLDNTQTGILKVEVLNYDDRPLVITSVKAYYECIDLIAKLPLKGDTYLCYGNPDASAPVYDLVHFADKLPTDAPVIAYGKAEGKILSAKIKEQGWIENKIWLWIAICSLVVLIGFFALKMIRNEQSNS